MMRFLVPRASIENVNVVQSEAEVEEPPPNVVNEFNSNEIVRDPGLRKLCPSSAIILAPPLGGIKLHRCNI
ncbi:unnamed protein product [Trifolium pratense]|uniref:Uncharacterized protein n=2 Tax=Trifolium pratense TaxID=57577 RepID=A0ACB0JJM1_TRIPR|nr:unnamed protein product [Trifolium pratense]